MRKTATKTTTRRAAGRKARSGLVSVFEKRALRRAAQRNLAGSAGEDRVDHSSREPHTNSIDPVTTSEILGSAEGGVSTEQGLNPRASLSTTAPHHDDSDAVVDEIDQNDRLSQKRSVDLVTPSAKPKARKPRVKKSDADGEVVHYPPEIQELPDSLSTLIDTITMTWRQRMVLVKQGTAGINRAVGFCRTLMDGDKDAGQDLYDKAVKGKDHPKVMQALPVILAMNRAKDSLDADKAEIEKRLIKLAKDLPASRFILETKGVSLLYFAGLIGEAGDLSNYPMIDPDRDPAARGPAALRKRFGLAPLAGKAGSNWKKTSKAAGGLTADEWKEFGYVGRRRNVIWQIGNGLIGGMGRGPRPLVGEDIQARTDWTEYQKLFVAEMIRLAERDPERHARPATDEGKMSFSKHAADMAKRFVEQQFLRDLWVEWRRERGQAMNVDDQRLSTTLTLELAA